MATKRRKPKPLDSDRIMAIFRDGRAIDAAVARATCKTSESPNPRRCPTCGTLQPPK